MSSITIGHIYRQGVSKWVKNISWGDTEDDLE